MFGMGKKAAQPPPPPSAPASPAEPPVRVTVHLTPAQRDLLHALGGDAWLQARLDEAGRQLPLDN